MLSGREDRARRSAWARALRRFLRGRDGIALSEFAIVLPVLVFFVFGGLELGRYVLLNQKLSRIAVSTSDLVSQAKKVTQDDIDQIFVAATRSFEPFELAADGAIVVSSVGTETAPVTPRVLWQRTGAGSAAVSSVVGATGATAALPNGFALRENQNVIIAEVFYDYQPFFFAAVIPGQRLYHTAFHRPRLAPLLQISPTP